MALSATATVEVRADLQAQLRLESPKLALSSFDRPEIYFEVLSTPPPHPPPPPPLALPNPLLL